MIFAMIWSSADLRYQAACLKIKIPFCYPNIRLQTDFKINFSVFQIEAGEGTDTVIQQLTQEKVRNNNIIWRVFSFQMTEESLI